MMIIGVQQTQTHRDPKIYFSPAELIFRFLMIANTPAQIQSDIKKACISASL
jgi:hypothetical protein